jgi:hypothetical protein
MRIKGKITLFLGLISAVNLMAQAHIDARGLGLCDAYTVTSRGVSCIGYNPANLGYSEDLGFSMNLIDFNFQAYNNFMSLTLFNEYFTGDVRGNPINLEANKPGYEMSHKNYLLSLVPEEGFEVGLGVSVPIPGLNVSVGNYAFTSGIDYYQRNLLPKGLFRLLFRGNPVGQQFPLTLTQDVLMVANMGFSVAIPFEKYNLGFTMKYLAGIGYAGVDSSGGNFATQATGLESDGFYRFTRAIGGNGMALDIGFNTRKMGNWQYGIAVNNVIGFINWGKDDTYIAKGIGAIEAFVPIRELLQIPTDGSQFTASTLNVLDMQNVTVTEALANGDSLFALRTEEVDMPDSLRLNYPAIFRAGASYQYENDFILMADISAGLDDYYFASRTWRFAVAAEWIRFKMVPIRSGLAFGGPFGREASIGTGVHLIWFDADLALKFLGGMSFATAEGIEFGINFQFKR